jgi:hypothetical protein
MVVRMPSQAFSRSSMRVSGASSRLPKGRELNFIEVEFGKQVTRLVFVVLKAFLETREAFSFSLQGGLDGLFQPGPSE